MIHTAKYSSIFECLDKQPTACQSKALYQIEEFLSNADAQKIFVLRGSAGTGKTTITKAIVQYLNGLEICSYLMAPTGKASSILKEKSGVDTSTIHHLVYLPVQLEDGKVFFSERDNDANVRTVFIVDEASMIASVNASKGEFISEKPLLEDLIRYVKQGHSENQIIFLGDNYQLRPVGEQSSVALEAGELYNKYGLSSRQMTMKEVVRQAGESPVLKLALQVKSLKDVGGSIYTIRPPRLSNSAVALNYFLTYFDKNRLDEVVMICKSNDQVFEWNHTIRKSLDLHGKTLRVGDVVMLRSGWMDGHHSLVNGETGVVKTLVGEVEELEGFRFQDAEIIFRTGSDEKVVLTKVLLDSLENSKGQIDSECMKMLKHHRMKHNSVYRQTQMAKDDPYMNAIRLNYGYAVTCHKAQGSEWKRVLYDSKGLCPTDYAWLYTAVTRAREEVVTWWF